MITLFYFIVGISTFYGSFYVLDKLWCRHEWWASPTIILAMLLGFFLSIALIGMSIVRTMEFITSKLIDGKYSRPN